ncbi:MAG: glycosyltransferase family 2 protein [Propionibacterium sp.]|nr:glycosyltransferase family 2 protein [Propionibacterium sp.]
METFDLTAVIPSHNAQDTIGALVEDFLAIPGLRVQVVVVDDASSDATPQILQDLMARHPEVLAMLQHSNRGAGVVRNVGFPAAAGRYTIFFDADDQLHPDALLAAVRELDRGGQDVAILKYRYVRGGQDADVAMNSHDLHIWEQVLGSASSRTVRLTGAPDLLHLTNYPWNKVVRTATFQSSGLRFGSTPVNNDILGHWHTLLFADRIVLINQEVCTHIVLAGGSNLTNRSSLDRLTLFDALDETYDLLQSRPGLRRRYAHIYWASVIRIAGWAGARVDPSVRDLFEARLQQHLLRIRITDFHNIQVRRAPSLAQTIVRKAMG